MCGFIGAFDGQWSVEEIRKAAESIVCRGPDGTSVLQRGPLILAAHRLAIVPPLDILPILDDGSSALALNGEIFDLPERKREPAISDLEALGKHLARRGTSALAQLRGLFAFCWFDGHRLLLARDRFGIKPLYYAALRGGLVFASEMKALLALRGISRSPDDDVLSACEVVGHNVFPGRTPFREISSLKPGHALEAVVGDTLRQWPYATMPSVPTPGTGCHLDPDELSFRVEQLIERSVRRSMRHDPNKKAIFFSGGLDSTLLLEVARREGPVRAYVLSGGEPSDDLSSARLVANALDVPLEECFLGVEDLDREIVHYAWHFEHPVAGGAFDLLGGVAFHSLARRVAAESRVAFCGEGADELFLGYHRLHTEPRLALEMLTRRIGLNTSAVLREWFEGRFSERDTNALATAFRSLALREGLSEYHLPSVDRSGMAFGLEIRPPYLDEDLVDLCVALDERCLLDRGGGWTKIPLRAIARRRLSPLGLDRVAVRRKLAMPAAARRPGEEIRARLAESTGGASLDEVMWRLFRFLFLAPGVGSRPSFTLTEFAEECFSADDPPGAP
jgi:asparagine synthase (glutamine-hydrolysing)